MSRVCLITDSSVQFAQANFPGKNDIRIIPFGVHLKGVIHPDGSDLRPADLPSAASDILCPRLVPPPAEEIARLLLQVNQTHTEIIAVLSSSELTPMVQRVQEAADMVKGRVRLTLVDSQTISLGLGLLLQIAAESLNSGQSADFVEHLLRRARPHVYTLLCTSNPSYLYHAGFIDKPQSVVSEMLGLIPIFTLEDGHLSPLEKVRSQRNLTDFFQEFLAEYDDLQHIAFLQSVPSTYEVRVLHDFAFNAFPKAPFTEHVINLSLATLIGPKPLVLVVMERKFED